MGLLVKVDGSASLVEPKNGEQFTLEELREFVGGYIQLVSARIEGWPFVAFVNEEGKLKGLPINFLATIMTGVQPYDVIVGDMIVCDPSEVD